MAKQRLVRESLPRILVSVHGGEPLACTPTWRLPSHGTEVLSDNRFLTWISGRAPGAGALRSPRGRGDAGQLGVLPKIPTDCTQSRPPR